MSLADLAVLYLIVGLACAVAIYRTSPEPGRRAVASAALAVPLWPLWAPIALTVRGGSRPAPPQGDAAKRVMAALDEGVEACASTPLEALLSRDAAARIAVEVTRAADRHAELEELLRRDGFALDEASQRVAELERSGASARALAPARLHLDNVKRLAALRDRDALALEELADLVQALRTQLVLARFAGSPVAGASGIVSEVWARVEGLGAAIDAQGEGEREVEAALAG